jgi:hypothetical protein
MDRIENYQIQLLKWIDVSQIIIKLLIKPIMIIFNTLIYYV